MLTTSRERGSNNWGPVRNWKARYSCVCTCEEGALSKGGEARRRKTQGGKREGCSREFEFRFGFELSIDVEN